MLRLMPFLPCLLWAGAAVAQQPAETLLAAERALSDASALRGLTDAIPAALAPQGALLWPGAPVVIGAAQARTLLSAQRVLDSVRLSWQPLAAELSADGSMGATWGVVAITRTGAPTRMGRYIAAWIREAGAWKLAAFVAQGVLPPAAG